MTVAPVKDQLSRQSLFVSIAIILAGAFVAGAILYNGAHAPASSTTATTQNPDGTMPADISKVKTDGEPFIGDENAPVTMAFWSDFQCPYCKAVETGGVPQIQTPAAMPDIIKNYVDTGKVKIVFKDYPFLGNDSITGAEYGRSIWKLYPDTYFTWRTAMYEAQDAEGDTGFGNADSIDKLNATIPGLDAAKIKADVADNKTTYDAEIEADKADGSAQGIQGTPGTIIGKELIPGAYPYATFSAAIDAALKKS